MRSLAIDKSLEGIAGIPLAMLSSPGSVVVSSPLGAFEGRTLYTVMNIINTNAAWSSVSSLGDAGNIGQLRMQMREVGSPIINGYVDTVNGSVGLHVIPSNTLRVPGKSVIGWLSVTDGMTRASGGLNSSVGNTIECIPGNGMQTNPRLFAYNKSDISCALAIAYRGEHNLSTRTRILNWLSVRYSIQF